MPTEPMIPGMEQAHRALLEQRRQTDLFRPTQEEARASRMARLRRHVSLDEWPTLSPEEQHVLLHISGIHLKRDTP